MNISTKDLADVLDEAESFTLAHCADIIAAAARVSALGPLPTEPPLPDHVSADPATYSAIINARDRRLRAAVSAYLDAQEAVFDNVRMPLNWHHHCASDHTVAINHVLIRRDYTVNPNATPEDLLTLLRAGTVNAITKAAADWRAQSADLLARATLAERLATAMFPNPEPTP